MGPFCFFCFPALFVFCWGLCPVLGRVFFPQGRANAECQIYPDTTFLDEIMFVAGECGMTEGPRSTKLPQSWDTGSD